MEEGYHINEVVADSLAISPFQYGLLTWAKDNGISYTTKELDVAGWVRSEEAYRLWERNLPDSKLFAEINEMIRDTGSDFNTWESVLEYGRRNDGIGNDISPQS
jgi:hypothetical protein